jgi:hypothetical protein
VNGSNGPPRTDHARAITRITASSSSENQRPTRGPRRSPGFRKSRFGTRLPTAKSTRNRGENAEGIAGMARSVPPMSYDADRTSSFGDAEHGPRPVHGERHNCTSGRTYNRLWYPTRRPRASVPISRFCHPKQLWCAGTEGLRPLCGNCPLPL